MVEKAKELCEDLLANVREQFEEFKARPPRNFGGGGGGGGGGGDRYGERSRDNSGSYQGYNNHSHHSNSHHGGSSHYNNSNASGANAGASASSQASPSTAGASDYAAQYAQYYGQDPYAAYGGYNA